MINATSAAANKSSIKTAAIIATEINNAEEILLIPLLRISFFTAAYTKGSPLIKIVTQARFPKNSIPTLGNTKLAIKKTPPTIVAGIDSNT